MEGLKTSDIKKQVQVAHWYIRRYALIGAISLAIFILIGSILFPISPIALIVTILAIVLISFWNILRGLGGLEYLGTIYGEQKQFIKRKKRKKRRMERRKARRKLK